MYVRYRRFVFCHRRVVKRRRCGLQQNISFWIYKRI